MTKEEMIAIRGQLDPKIDNGKKAGSKWMNDADRKLAAFAIGTNAALIQFVTEGILPAEEQAHFMMHLQDFAARLYAGEDIAFPAVAGIDLTSGEETVQQTFSVDSVLGEVYLAAAELGLKEGRVVRRDEQGKEINNNEKSRLN